MPSTETLVNDLNAGRIHGIGRKPNDVTTQKVLSGRYKVKFLNLNMKVSLSEGKPQIRMSCDKATSIDINGTYLHFADGWTTVTRIDKLRPIVVSGNFSGCAYHIYKGQGAIYCAHIARPGGARSEENVNLMREYASSKGWTLLQDIGTRGRAPVKGEVVVVSQLVGHRINSIRLEVNNSGIIVGKTFLQSNA